MGGTGHTDYCSTFKMKPWCFEMATEFFRFIHTSKGDSIDCQDTNTKYKKNLELSCTSLSKLIKENSKTIILDKNDKGLRSLNEINF